MEKKEVVVDKSKKTDKKDKQMELSDEDKEYKFNLDTMINGLFDSEIEIRKNAFNMIKNEILTSTSSMTSIPRPLKFFRLHYDKLKEFYNSLIDLEYKNLIGQLLSVLVLVCPNTQDTALQYVLDCQIHNITEWGQEYNRSLAGEIGQEYLNRLEEETPCDNLIGLVNIIVPYFIEVHNENEAIDLLIEMDKLDDINNYTTSNNYKRIALYLITYSNYAADSEELKKNLEIAYQIYSKYNEHANALRVAIKLSNMMFIKSTFLSCSDRLTQIQMAFILARQKIWLESENIDTELSSIISNLKTSEYYKKLGRSLDLTEPKHPEEVFKSHLEEKKSDGKIDSYKNNMAYSIASSFINAGFGTESLLSKKGDDWMARNKDEGLLCLIAGLGLVNIWDIDCGPNEMEKYMKTNEVDHFKRGGYNIGLGIISSGVRDENYTAMALLTDQLVDQK